MDADIPREPKDNRDSRDSSTRDIAKSWSQYLRQTTSQPPKAIVCSICHETVPNGGSDIGVFRRHLSAVHPRDLEARAPGNARNAWIRQLWNNGQSTTRDRESSKTLSGGQDESPKSGTAPSGGEGSQPSPDQASNQKKGVDSTLGSLVRAQPDSDSTTMRSNPSSLKREGSRSRSQSPPKRSKALPASALQSDKSRPDFDRGPFRSKGHGKGRLWNPDEDPPSPSHLGTIDKNNVASNHRLRLSSSTSHSRGQRTGQFSGARPSQQDDNSTELIKQPETRPISQEQLVAEVKGIYAGLVMVENKCIEVDTAQNTQSETNNTKLNNEQWQALIALHRTLLHEHHDFFLASQHPSASPALRRLASKYAMPARMWRHGIHSFLELLRHRLPASLEHMLTFIYLAYSMMALLYETVPAFEDTWIECLGDLGRYRMAIEDDNIRDREVWTAVSRGWYSKASDKAPTTGRLYHHLAILARPNALQQLFYYTKSLCVAIPFVSARDSIMTLFEPVLAQNPNQQTRLPPAEHAFVRLNAVLFSKKMQDKLNPWMDEFIASLDNHIGRFTLRFREPGTFMAISLCCAIIGYGSESDLVFQAFKQGDQQDQPMAGSTIDESGPRDISDALRLANRTHNVILRRFGDSNILTYVHVVLVFIHHATYHPEAMAFLAPTFPWKLMSLMLNTLLGTCQAYARFESDRFPRPEKEDPPRPLPEDYAMRGILWAEKYFPNEWFVNDKIEDDEKGLEAASMGEERKVRVLYLGCRIARNNKWLRYDSETHQFSVSPEYDIELEPIPVDAAAESTELEELPDALSD